MDAEEAKVHGSSAMNNLYVVCVTHLILCVIILSVSLGEPVAIGGLIIYPGLQFANSAFHCLCIVSLIAAAIGNLYLIQSHVVVYMYMLALSVLVDVSWISIFAFLGHGCTTTDRDGSHFSAKVTCGFSSTEPIIFLFLSMMFKGFGVFTASGARQEIRNQYSMELLPYLKQSLHDSTSMLGGTHAERMNSTKLGSNAVHMPPMQATGSRTASTPTMQPNPANRSEHYGSTAMQMNASTSFRTAPTTQSATSSPLAGCSASANNGKLMYASAVPSNAFVM